MAKSSIQGLLKTIGPGILFAGAAIGGSHLIQSTRAGANYGFDLLIIVVLVNLFKYPFFEFGHRYAHATGKNLIDGYRQIGLWAVSLFFIMLAVLNIVNVAAVCFVTASLLEYTISLLFSVVVDHDILTPMLLVAVTAVSIIGKYKALDLIVKIMIVVLSISTLAAFILAASNGMQAIEGYQHKEILTGAGVMFIIALMGWMPSPIELSVWTSIWSNEKKALTGYKPKWRETMTDFHIGYVGTTIMAILFLGLGAFVMYGQNIEFAQSGVKFSEQLISVYGKTLGQWSAPLIAIVALVTMLSTSFTCMDAYPKSVDLSLKNIFNSFKSFGNKSYYTIQLITIVSAYFIIELFIEDMKGMLDVATVISFLAAPVFAVLNFAVVRRKDFPIEYRPKQWLVTLSWLGIIFLSGFSILYLLTRYGVLEY
jgi:Mn2+/Fe2+ NRAMP family transporter